MPQERQSKPSRTGTGRALLRPVTKALTGTDRRTLLLPAAALLVLVIAALLPLAFRADPASAAGQRPAVLPALEEKSALFSAYWYDEGASVSVEKGFEPPAATRGFCRRRMDGLIARCIDDERLGAPDAGGTEYAIVTGPDGASLRLCRSWLQARGDWQNWLDVCFDAEDGTLYYLYCSRECLTNLSHYAGTVRPDLRGLAAELSAAVSGRLRLLTEEGVAVIAAPEGVLCYRLSGTLTDTLVDVRINSI